MIAQGEFKDLLNAKTEQRTEILRTIFMTDGYKNMEYKLKDRMDASYAVKRKTEDSIIQYFGDVSAAEDDRWSGELTELQDKARESGSVWNLEELLEFLELSDSVRERNTACGKRPASDGGRKPSFQAGSPGNCPD